MDTPIILSDPITRESECWPMSSNQQRVWFIEQLTDGTSANNLYVAVRLIGELDIAALDLSLRTVVDRHESLRTTFDVRDDEPVQCVHLARPAELGLIDLSTNTGSDAEREAYALARREVHKPFDLRGGPLVRLVLLRLDRQTHIMLSVLHHIICDGHSLGLFVRELGACYAAFCSGAKPEWGRPLLQYADYAIWQREWLHSGDFRRQLSYWTRRLEGAPLVLDLSADDVLAAERSFGGASQARPLSADLMRQLKAVARQYDATPFALSLAVFQIVLCHYTGQRDFLVGMPVTARRSVELEGVIGLLANLVVIRADLTGDPSFPDILRKVRDAILGALIHQDVPFEKLVEALHPARSVAQNPVFQVLFAAIKAMPLKSFGDLQASPYVVRAAAAPFDLSVSIIEAESPDPWWLRADYRTDFFTDDQIDLLLGHYINLLNSIVARPEARLSELKPPPTWPAVNRPRYRGVVSDTEATLGELAVRPRIVVSNLSQWRPEVRSEPRELVEDALASLWEKVLGTHPPTTAANFFDFGGHSLAAIRFAAEIGRAYGTEFPVSLIFQEPTIKGLTRCLEKEAFVPSSVVFIQGAGSRPPFFCGGSMREIRDLSPALGPQHPFFQLDVFALQERRMLAGEPLCRSVPDLAAPLLQEILSIQPRGPYFLGGMCEGGIIALEIALQLQAQGHEVGLLAEFDTPVNGYWRKRPIDWLLHGYSLAYSGRLLPRMREQFRARARRHAPMSVAEKQFMHISQVIWDSIRAYRSNRMFKGEIQIFRAPRSPGWFREDVVAGWAARSSHGIRVHEVAGNHVKIFGDLQSQRIITRVIEDAYRHSLGK